MIEQLNVKHFEAACPIRNWNLKPFWLTALAACAVIGAGRASEAALISRNIGVTLDASALDTYNLDVDQNGTNDFTFETAYVPDPVLTVGFDQIRFLFGSNNGVVIDTQTGDGFPPTSLLVQGNTVSSSSLFSTSSDDADLFFDDTIDPTTGNFGGKTGYVGFKFDGTGGTHFGYVQVTVTSLNDPSTPLNLTLGNLVYNDVAGVAVLISAVPEPVGLAALLPATLGMLGRARRKSR